MDLTTKVLVLPNICGIELVASNTPTPSVNPSLQPFYNTYVQESDAQEAYFSPSKATFRERSSQTAAGHLYEQSLTLKFASNDPYRAKRISDYLKVKYIYIKLSSGMVFYFGRNDYNQNAAPKISTSSDEKSTQITYTIKSIQPIGFTNGSFDFQLSEELPANFYNL